MSNQTLGTAVKLACAFTVLLGVTERPANSQPKLAVDGSTGTAPLVAALGKAFTDKTGIAIEVGKGLGTKARFEALAAGKIDVAMASHGLKAGEVTAMGMTVHRIAVTPVVFAVHHSVTARALTDSQLCAIYGGRGRNWNEFAAGDLVIIPLTRPDSEVDAEVARDGIACLKGLQMSDTVKVMPRAGDMAKALAETPGGIGMTSATVVEQSRGNVRPIALNGIEPSEAEVAAGRYRLTRDAFLVTRNEASPEVTAFIGFVQGPEGAAVIRANGAIPMAR